MSAAASAWNAATPQTKITWRAFANARRQNTFAFFFLYWKTQQLDHAQWDLSTIILNADPPQSVDGTPLFFPLEPLETIRPTTPMTGISKLSAIPARLGQLRLTQATPGRS